MSVASSMPRHATPKRSPRERRPPRARPAADRGRFVRRTPADADLGFELYRQHTLLTILSESLRHTAAEVLAQRDVVAAGLPRALEVHRGYLINIHYPDEERVLEALEPSSDPLVFDGLVECRAEHPQAAIFQREVARLWRSGIPGAAGTLADIAKALRQEADRIEVHLAREEELLTSHLNRWLSRTDQARLLGLFREFDNARISAEIAVLVWASEIAPSVD